MKQTVTEPERRIPVTAEYDVAVVGGGIAGVAAALAAARNGARTCLIEKENGLGGLATLGNVTVYLPLCDGKGHQVIAGIGEELLRLSVRDGFEKVPPCWEAGGDEQQRQRVRFRVSFNPSSFMLDLEELMLQGKVDLWYDTRFCDVIREKDAIVALVVENKGGRQAFLCRTVVDASGDADVCARAGEDTESVKTNVAAAWFYCYDGGKGKLSALSKPFFPDPGKEQQAGVRGYAGDDGRDVTGQILESRQMIRERLQKLRKDAGDKPLSPAVLPTIPTFRMTRRLRGAVELTMSDDHRYFEDALGMTGSWRTSGPVFYLPLRCLTAVRTPNLITAGRCISAAGACWDVTRVIPTCAVSGEAAGAAAALASRETGGRIAAVNVPALQERLRQQKALIDKSFAKA